MNTERQEAALNAATAKIEGNVIFDTKIRKTHGNVLFPGARIAHFFEMQNVVSPDESEPRSAFCERWNADDSQEWLAAAWATYILTVIVYDSIEARAKQERGNSVAMANLADGAQFLAQPYGQLAKTLRNMGIQDEATKVAIAKNELSLVAAYRRQPPQRRWDSRSGGHGTSRP